MLLWLMNMGFAGGSSAIPEVTPEVTPPEPSAGAWPSREQYKKKKRQAILDDDEELMRLIAMAFPEIIKRYKDG